MLLTPCALIRTGEADLGAVLGLHVQDLVADALPNVTLAPATNSHQSQAERVAQAPALVQHARQPARQPVLPITSWRSDSAHSMLMTTKHRRSSSRKPLPLSSMPAKRLVSRSFKYP